MTATASSLDLRVRQLTYESDGVVSIGLVGLDDVGLPEWEPGAHVDLRLADGLVRQYSLCGSPADHRQYAVAVLHEPGGRGGSRYVHESLRPGARVGIGGPRNTFVLEPAPGYLFVAGGIGITPFLPMIDRAERDGVPWRLLYGGRTRRGMAFLDRLARYGDRVQVVPQDECGLLDLDTALAGLPGLGAGALVYGCGPEPLLTALERRCAPWGEDVLRVERFAAPTTDPGSAARDAAAGEFLVELARTGRTLVVEPGTSVLERLAQDGIEVPSDCQEGICGSCRVGVLAGEPDHRDHVLTTRQRRAGDTMMTCVSRCRGDRLVLDL
jgi:ferredoxin-NADP reductase